MRRDSWIAWFDTRSRRRGIRRLVRPGGRAAGYFGDGNGDVVVAFFHPEIAVEPATSGDGCHCCPSLEEQGAVSFPAHDRVLVAVRLRDDVYAVESRCPPAGWVADGLGGEKFGDGVHAPGR